MKKTDILHKLCWYDKRNPLLDFDKHSEEDTKSEKNDCWCDNCCGGATELAVVTLQLLNCACCENGNGTDLVQTCIGCHGHYDVSPENKKTYLIKWELRK